MEQNKFKTIVNVIKSILTMYVATLITLTVINECSTETKEYNEHGVIDTDTVITKHIIDSIEYNIKHRDSVIINYKTKIEYEKQKALNVSDSDAVVMFHQLSAE